MDTVGDDANTTISFRDDILVSSVFSLRTCRNRRCYSCCCFCFCDGSCCLYCCFCIRCCSYHCCIVITDFAAISDTGDVVYLCFVIYAVADVATAVSNIVPATVAEYVFVVADATPAAVAVVDVFFRR
jgi:hypothetical protein